MEVGRSRRLGREGEGGAEGGGREEVAGGTFCRRRRRRFGESGGGEKASQSFGGLGWPLVWSGYGVWGWIHFRWFQLQQAREAQIFDREPTETRQSFRLMANDAVEIF